MKEKVPDLTAYPLDEAISILKKMNLDFLIKKTAPSWRQGDGSRHLSSTYYRVLKQTEIGDNIIELIIAAEK